jgi:hypothetical protein
VRSSDFMARFRKELRQDNRPRTARRAYRM